MEERFLEFIQSQIGYYFNNLDLLQQAFTRRSYSEENGGENNEVLEFIGDKVLDYFVVKLLISQNGNSVWESVCYIAEEEMSFSATISFRCRPFFSPNGLWERI